MRWRIVLAAGAALTLAVVIISRKAPGPAAESHAQTPSDAPALDEIRAKALSRLPPSPAPDDSISNAVAATPAPPAAGTNWIDKLLGTNGELTELPREAIDRWLASGRTNAEDLLAARQAGGGREFLRTALTNFPNDPRVLVQAMGLDDGPEALRERLDRLKTAAPDNALADYLSARDHLKNGRTEQALTDLLAASAKGRFENYALDMTQTTEELYLQAGKSPAEAKALACSSTLLPELAQFKGLAQDMAALQRQYLDAGDTAGAERLAQYGRQLAGHLTDGDGSRTLIGQLVGLAIERISLSPLDRGRDYDFLGGNVDRRLEQLNQRRAAYREDVRLVTEWTRGANDAELLSYFDRFKLYGESAAMQWARQRMQTR